MGTMKQGIEFFDSQFRRLDAGAGLELNPFEELALGHLFGEVLDLGCGLGNLAIAAARRGCRVTAVDGSPVAIERLRQRAARESLPVSATLAELRDYPIAASHDCIVAIGLLMFFDCRTASRMLAAIQDHVRPGGIAVVNLLVEGTSYLEMFDPDDHCLFAPSELLDRFAGWQILHDEARDFPAPRDTLKRFSTVIARKPGA